MHWWAVAAYAFGQVAGQRLQSLSSYQSALTVCVLTVVTTFWYIRNSPMTVEQTHHPLVSFLLILRVGIVAMFTGYDVTKPNLPLTKHKQIKKYRVKWRPKQAWYLLECFNLAVELLVWWSPVNQNDWQNEVKTSYLSIILVMALFFSSSGGCLYVGGTS